MIHLKSLINLREKMDNEPAHFDSGENINVRGYETQNFDICGSAVALYKELDQITSPGAGPAIIKSAELMDHLFELEKQVVRENNTSPEQINKASELSVEWSYKIGQLSQIINQKMLNNIEFVITHMKEIFIRAGE